MRILLTFMIVVAVFPLGCSPEPEPPANRTTKAPARKLGTLLERMNRAEYLNKLPERDFDSLVACIATNLEPTDSSYELLTPVLEKIAQAAEGDSYFIEVLLRLDTAVKSNAELSESLPEYVDKAVILNPLGFTQLYRGFTEKRRSSAIDLLTFVWNPKLIPPFRDLANSSRDPAVKHFAEMIADSLEAYMP